MISLGEMDMILSQFRPKNTKMGEIAAFSN